MSFRHLPFVYFIKTFSATNMNEESQIFLPSLLFFPRILSHFSFLDSTKKIKIYQTLELDFITEID